MPFIDETIEDINESLMTEIFSKGDLQGTSLFGSGYIQKREKEAGVFDYVVEDLSGKPLSPDDSHPCVIYHRMISGTFADDIGFGGDRAGTKESTQMLMVVWAKRSIMVHESTLASWIADVLNKNYAKADLTETGISKLQTRAVSVTYDSAQVWNTEYKNTNYPFGVEEVMFFSIQYIIESTYSKGCFATCPDC